MRSSTGERRWDRLAQQGIQGAAAVRKAHKGESGTFVAWLLDGAAPEDAAAMREETPPPVVAVLIAIPGRRYRKTIAAVWSP